MNWLGIMCGASAIAIVIITTGVDLSEADSFNRFLLFLTGLICLAIGGIRK